MSLGESCRKFRAFDQKGLLFSRVKGPLAFSRRGYVVDRRIFRIPLFVTLGLLAYLFFTSPIGWREVYVHCPENNTGPCHNPFYHDCPVAACKSIEAEQWIPAGFELGRPPDQNFMNSVQAVVWAFVAGLFLAFVMNHLLHNRGRSFLLLFPKLEDGSK